MNSDGNKEKVSNKSMVYHKRLDQSQIERIYKAMGKDDLADVVMTAVEVMAEADIFIQHPNTTKSESESDSLRLMGNNYYNKGKYATSIQWYNKALANAPLDGRAIKLAYSNRSALLFNTECYIDCIKDIDRCFELGCPPDIEKKLINRRQDATSHVPSESFKMKCKDYFKIKNPTDNILPYISPLIKFEINEEYEPRIIAVDEIKSGTILVHEFAYVSSLQPEDKYIACYYCMKYTPCLLPCDNCCVCMFCSEECKIKCNNEYHDIECKLNEIVSYRPVSLLIIKTIVMLRKKANSWQELIEASKLLGTERIKSSNLKEILNRDSPYSILNFPDNRPFAFGPMYNSCYECAEVVNRLSEFPSFYPPQNSPEHIEAKRAIGRIMMYLSTYGTPTVVVHSVFAPNISSVGVKPSVAYFTCLGKVKVSCYSNAENYYLNNKAVLIAKHKINPGEEILVSALNGPERCDQSTREDREKLFFAKKYVCPCPTCLGKSPRFIALSEKQKQFCKQFNIMPLLKLCDRYGAVKHYEVAKKIMDCLSNVPYSREYIEAYHLYYKCLIILTNTTTDNIIIGCHQEAYSCDSFT